MNKLYKLIKRLILSSIILFSFITLYFFFYFNQIYKWNSIELKANWMFTILFFIVFFYIFFFLVKFKFYNITFLIIVTIGVSLWIIIYLLEIFNAEIDFWNLSIIRDSTTIICISILSPGFTLNIIRFIRHNSDQNRKKKVFKNYHIHEGFVGILFVIFAFFLWIVRYVMIQYEIMRKTLRIFLAIDMIVLYLFLFSGSFLIFRDRRDLIQLKFIEKQNSEDYNISSSVFNPITPDSIKFYKFPKILCYPFGLLLSSISLSMFIHRTDFLPKEIFKLSHETIVFIGFILCFISGGMIGIDWFRLFAKIYPELYQEIEQILYRLKKSKN